MRARSRELGGRFGGRRDRRLLRREGMPEAAATSQTTKGTADHQRARRAVPAHTPVVRGVRRLAFSLEEIIASGSGFRLIEPDTTINASLLSAYTCAELVCSNYDDICTGTRLLNL